MLVYRICKKDEIENILRNRGFYNVGKNFHIDKKKNTHPYENDKKYLHFFKNKDSIFYLNTDVNYFICTYDIPNHLLAKNVGIGFYLDRTNFDKLEEVEEFAIESKQIKFDYLLKIEAILDNIDFEDYIFEDIAYKVETIYSYNAFLEYLSNNDGKCKILKLYNILMSDDVVKEINSNFNELIELIPEIKSMVGFEHKHPHHHLDVWEHTMYALSLSVKDFDVRLSLLLHDIGKPFSYNEEDGIRHFHNHPIMSEEMSKKILTRLGFDNKYVERICYLVKYHDTPINQNDVNNNFDIACTLYLIQECDALAHNPSKLEKRKKYLESTKSLILKK